MAYILLSALLHIFSPTQVRSHILGLQALCVYLIVLCSFMEIKYT